MGDIEDEKRFTIFGRSIEEIPCFRDSYVYGICTGIVSGLGYFMFTSRVRVSTNFGMGAFCISTLSYWSYCRWKYSEKIKQGELIKSYLRESLLKERMDPSNDKDDIIASV